MQAIETKYLPPTNHRGARIRASCDALTITVAYEYSGSDAEHRAACAKLVAKLGWGGRWVMGTVKSLPRSYVHVCVSSK